MRFGATSSVPGSQTHVSVCPPLFLLHACSRSATVQGFHARRQTVSSAAGVPGREAENQGAIFHSPAHRGRISRVEAVPCLGAIRAETDDRFPGLSSLPSVEALRLDTGKQQASAAAIHPLIEWVYVELAAHGRNLRRWLFSRSGVQERSPSGDDEDAEEPEYHGRQAEARPARLGQLERGQPRGRDILCLPCSWWC